jgi:hypothetical protein
MKKVLMPVLFVLALASSSCSSASEHNGKSSGAAAESKESNGRGAPGRQAAFETPAVVARLEDPSVTESSGLAASRCNPGLLWTHNDSGDGPYLYATDERGWRRGTWRVTAAEARDWEDVALGPGPQPGRDYLYIGDIGDNQKARREISVYRVVEPQVATATAASSRKNPVATEAAEMIRLRYPDGSHDAEALLVHPTTGDLYVITKTLGTAPGVYKLTAPYSTAGVNKLTLSGVIRGMPAGLITGGDIAPGGAGVVLCDYFGAYELTLPGGGATFDEIWGQAVASIDLGQRQQGEAVCYAADGNTIYATSEMRPTPLIKVNRAKSPK